MLLNRQSPSLWTLSTFKLKYDKFLFSWSDDGLLIVLSENPRILSTLNPRFIHCLSIMARLLKMFIILLHAANRTSLSSEACVLSFIPLSKFLFSSSSMKLR